MIDNSSLKSKLDAIKSSSVYLPGDILPVSNSDVDKSAVARIFPGWGVKEETLYLDESSIVEGEEDEGLVMRTQFRTSVRGTIDRIDRMVLMKSKQAKYNAAVGDLVVGRITKVSQHQSTWSVDIGSQKVAQLPLSSVTLHDDEQRRRTVLDGLAMRQYMKEDDIIVAEVQRTNPSNFNVVLHTRNKNFGKLWNGLSVQVSPHLIRRSDEQLKVFRMTELDSDSLVFRDDEAADGYSVYIVLGVNGWIWIGAPSKQEMGSSVELNHAVDGDCEVEVRVKLRSKIIRVKAIVEMLSYLGIEIDWNILFIFLQASGCGGLDFTIQDLYIERKRYELLQYVVDKRFEKQ